MKRETYVSIPQPCHENWNAMTPQNKGRFCASCAKTVIDFSGMSDTQVLNYLSQTTGRLCGRFAQDQIERPLVPLKIEKKKWWWMAALMPLTLLLNKADAQLNATKQIKQDSEIFRFEKAMSLDIIGTPQPGITHSVGRKAITGTIVDENKYPIANASVIIKGTRTGTVTDSLGKFHLSFTTDDTSVTINISYINYQTKELSYTFTDTDEININTQSLSPAPETLQDYIVAVAGYAIPHHPVKKIDTIKATVRKILHTNPFKVYPNPVSRGEAIQIAVKNEGHYSIQLLDANSKLIANSLFDAEKGITTTAILIPASASAGIYFIRLINDDTKQQFTDKIIVH